MIEIKINKNDEGQRLDKYLFKYFKEAPSSFVYKMLRKKNIVLNGKKSDGKDLIVAGDSVKIFMSDETIEKFSGKTQISDSSFVNDYYKQMPEIIYEDKNIMLINKPVGMLSQKADEKTVSLNEIALSYLIHENIVTVDDLKTFVPSICNRLDRNTCGIIIFAKTYKGANEMSALLRNRTMHKYYKCIVKGCIKEEITISGFLTKDEKNNTVHIDSKSDNINIYTKINPIVSNNDISLLEILLITGKTHQIRAHLASIGHPIIGDYKYGDSKINDTYKKRFGIHSQLLCACRLELPDNRVFEIDMPDQFMRVCKDGNMEV